MSRIRTVAIQILVLGFLLVLLAACQGSGSVVKNVATDLRGPAGPQGEPGPQGPAGKDGAPGKDYMPPPGNGLKMQITGVEVLENQTPVVTVTMTDENGQPISVETLEGWGFTIAQVEEDPTTHITRYQSLLVRDVEGKPYQWEGETRQPVMEKATQAYADSTGAWVDQKNGVYTYTFSTPLAAPVDPDRVTVVGLYAYKNNRASVVNEIYSFVKGGVYLIDERQIVTNAACNLCHNSLQVHGGTRSQTALCVTCHTDQTIDPETGNSLELKVLVHRLHSGSQLPSVQAGTPYMIVGFRQNVFNYSKGNWPQDPRYCITCHTGGTQSENFKTMPNTAACTSCHDTTNLATGENHPGGKQIDATCAYCHKPDGLEFDASITGGHIIPTQSKAVVVPNLHIEGVEGVAPGKSPVLRFRITNGAGEPFELANLASLSATLAGPTSDYSDRWTESIFSASSPNARPLSPDKDGVYEYTFKASIPADASGSYAVGMEAYAMEEVIPGGEPVRISAHNPVVYVALNGGDGEPRRQVVDITKCNVCHMNLSAHGTIRNNTEYCVLCHNANTTDEARRPAEAMPPTSINFPVLIHLLHRGEEAQNPLKVYGFGDRLFDFSATIFPGKLEQCETCHLPGTYGLPLAKSVQPTTITQEGNVVSTLLPVRAVCTSCHDSEETVAHAGLQTSASGVESCNVCHAPGREFDSIQAHQ